MGLLETLVGHVSVKSAVLLLPGLLLAYMIVAVIVRPAWQEIKLARMPGARAPRIKSVLPFGGCALERLGSTVCWLTRHNKALIFSTRPSARP